jgi:hypothetical protein
MSSRIGRRLVLALLGAVWAGGCDPTGPCALGIDQMGRYQADVLERYDAQSQFTYDVTIIRRPGWPSEPCSGADGIGPGASLVLQATGEMNRRRGFCDSVTADLTATPPEMTVVGPASNQWVRTEFAVALSGMFSTADVAFGGCTGSMGLGVYDGTEDVFAEPEPGSVPPAVLLRVFAPTEQADAACPACYDNFVIRFTKL